MGIRNETFPPPGARAAEPDRILILTAEHKSRSVVITGEGLTIGSKSDNDIVLDDPQVSEYHARIERGDDGQYRVIDLNSVTCTFMGDVRLRPGNPVDWIAEDALRVGENWLGLRLARDEAELKEAATQPTPPLPEIDPNQ